MEKIINKKEFVVVTGSFQGIGKTIANKFHSEGYYVEFVDIRKPLVNGSRKFSYQLDVTKKEDIINFVNYLKNKYENHNLILVNNVGKMITGSIEKITETDVLNAFRINALSQFLMIKYLMKEMNLTSVINISSNAGLQGFSSMAPYVMSKFAVIGLTQVVAKELAKKNNFSNANAICPSPLEENESEMSKRQVDQFVKNLNLTKDEVNKMLVSRIPQKRLCKASDIAELSFFLATKGKYITGQAISLTGGMIMVK